MSQVTAPILLDSTGQDISAKLQAIANAINGGTIDPLSVTQNGTYTPSGTTLGYGPVTVNVGGGGGSTNVLSGDSSPTAAQGSNGDIYLEYLSNVLPSGYTKRTYLEFVSGAYINTTVIPISIGIECSVSDLVYGNDKHWFGTDAGSSGSYTHFTTYSNKYFWGLSGTEASGGSWSAGDHLLLFNVENQIVLDGTVIGTGVSSSPSPLLIGRRGGTANLSNFRIYYFKLLSQNNALVKFFVPATRDSDSAAGLYELVSKTFYPNNGSGTLIAGPIDSTPLSGHEIVSTYAKVSGAWQSLIGTDINDINLGS